VPARERRQEGSGYGYGAGGELRGGKTKASNGPRSILSPALLISVTENLKYGNEESSVAGKSRSQAQVPCSHLKHDVLRTQCFQLHIGVG